MFVNVFFMLFVRSMFDFFYVCLVAIDVLQIYICVWSKLNVCIFKFMVLVHICMFVSVQCTFSPCFIIFVPVACYEIFRWGGGWYSGSPLYWLKFQYQEGRTGYREDTQQSKLGAMTTSCKVGTKKSNLKVDLKWSFSRLVLTSNIN